MFICLDISTAAIPNAADFIDKNAIDPPSNYKTPEAIEKYIEAEYQKRIARAGLDLDLARVTGYGYTTMAGKVVAQTFQNENDEMAAFERLAGTITTAGLHCITYNGLSFDLPLLMRRARYLGVKFPTLNLDRYKSPHPDLCALLSDRDPNRRRSLAFYKARLGWSDLVKPLSGEEEAQVPQTGRWAELEASLSADVEAVSRLAKWMGIW